jgi:hypothetical protein
MTGESVSCRDIALEFARSLATGRFESAHELLSQSLSASLTPKDLEREYQAMVAYTSTPGTAIEVLSTMDDWPTKEIEDIGWVYVSISDGESWGEAVTVVVSEENDRSVIRDIEWGRP